MPERWPTGGPRPRPLGTATVKGSAVGGRGNPEGPWSDTCTPTQRRERIVCVRHSAAVGYASMLRDATGGRCCKTGLNTDCRNHDDECDDRKKRDARMWACGTPGCKRQRRYAPTKLRWHPDWDRCWDTWDRCCQQGYDTNCREHDEECNHRHAQRASAFASLSLDGTHDTSGSSSSIGSATPLPATAPDPVVAAPSIDADRFYDWRSCEWHNTLPAKMKGRSFLETLD